MGMSTHLTGIRNMDANFKEMLEMKQLCDAKGFSYPVEVTEYFGNHLGESDKYIAEQMLHVEIPHKEFEEDMTEGIEIEVKDIPKEVKTILFYNSW